MTCYSSLEFVCFRVQDDLFTTTLPVGRSLVFSPRQRARRSGSTLANPGITLAVAAQRRSPICSISSPNERPCPNCRLSTQFAV